MGKKLSTFFILALIFQASVVCASEFIELSLKELMQIDVVSAFKTPQPLRRVAAAMHVISAEDIRRSGATSIPQVLRLVPGLQVLDFSHNRWAVSVRGSAREYSNKLQVLVDGRSVYSPTFSGVLWETLDLPLENIKRIEVIRGPGAAIWGANSVNGVVNFITKPASETKGTYISQAAGTDLKNSTFLSYGFDYSDKTAARIHVKGFEYGESRFAGAGRNDDFWRTRSLGFRVDKEWPGETSFSLFGNAYSSSAGEKSAPSPVVPAIFALSHNQKADGTNISARWNFSGADGSERTFQATLDYFRLDHFIIDEQRRTLDLDYTHRLALRGRHEVVWGASARFVRDKIDGPDYFRVFDRCRSSNFYRIFINDEITLREDLLFLTLSVGLDHDPLTKFEFQPSVRLMYTPGESDSVWLSLARSSRTPARLERGAHAITRINMPPVPFELDFLWELKNPERLESIDLGWRRKVSNRLSFDFNAFYYKFRDLVGIDIISENQLVPPGILQTRLQMANNKKSDIKGAELAFNWSATDRWRVHGSYSRLKTSRAANAPGLVTNLDWDVPQRAGYIFSQLDLNSRLQWDVWFKSTGAVGEKNLDSYNIYDTSISYKADKDFRLSFVVQNAFDKRYRSFIPVFSTTVQREFGRNIYLKAEWGF